MAGRVPAIHVFGTPKSKTWMPATSAGRTALMWHEVEPGWIASAYARWRFGGLKLAIARAASDGGSQ
jgi:hypothetical protein